jgi:hypothetical protein
MKYILLTLLLLTPAVVCAKNKHKLDPANPADFPLIVHVVRVEQGEAVYVRNGNGGSYSYSIMVVQIEGDSKTYRMIADGIRSVPLGMGTYRGSWHGGDLAISYTYPTKSYEYKFYVDWLKVIVEE